MAALCERRHRPWHSCDAAMCLAPELLVLATGSESEDRFGVDSRTRRVDTVEGRKSLNMC